MLPSTLPAAAVTSSKPVRLSAKRCQSTCATSATRSTPVSRRLWILAAVLIASRPVSVLSAQLKLLLQLQKLSKAIGLKSLFGFSVLIKKAPLAGAFFVSAIWLAPAQAEVFCPAPGNVGTFDVQRVVDGDT